MNNMILTETSFSSPTIQKKDTSTIKFKAILQELDKPGQNKRVYPRELVLQQLEKNKSKMVEKRFYGELDHPDGDDQERITKVSLKEQSHIVIDYQIVGDKIEGTLETIPTPNGLIVKALIENGNVLGISLRAIGSLKEAYSYNVVEDMQLITYDIVSDPSFSFATFSKKSLIESVEYILENNEDVENEVFKVDFINRVYRNFDRLNLLSDDTIIKFINYLNVKYLAK